MTLLQFLAPISQNTSPLSLGMGHVCLLSSDEMAPLRTQISPSPHWSVWLDLGSLRLYGRSAVDMSLFMDAHNQVLMFV